MKERDPELEWGDDFRVSTDREENWKEIEEDDSEYRGKVHALRWEVYMKDNEELIKR